jgi:hypothetical protein
MAQAWTVHHQTQHCVVKGYYLCGACFQKPIIHVDCVLQEMIIYMMNVLK